MPTDILEVHVSVTFSWDLKEGLRLARVYEDYCPNVKIGGLAIGGEGNEFSPGWYLKKGITITTRGCPNNCSFCLVGGNFRELEVKSGNIIQDNNVLAASKTHFRKVITMLNTQSKGAYFRGGLESRRLSDWHIEQLKRLRSIRELWFACDTPAALFSLKKAADKIQWLPRAKKRCYVLCAYNGQSIAQAEEILELVWGLGFMPFAQLYRPPTDDIEYSSGWKSLARTWSRPCVMRVKHNER